MELEDEDEAEEDKEEEEKDTETYLFLETVNNLLLRRPLRLEVDVFYRQLVDQVVQVLAFSPLRSRCHRLVRIERHMSIVYHLTHEPAVRVPRERGWRGGWGSGQHLPDRLVHVDCRTKGDM